MKIQGHPPTSIDPRTVQRERETPVPKPPTGGGAAEVRVSDSAKALGDARAPEQPDSARIERLRERVAKGELVIDAERIADAMLREER